MSVGDIFTLVVPLILPVIIGWALVQLKVASPSDAKPLTTVFLYVCAPATLIVLLASEDLDNLLDGRLIIGVVAGFAIVYAGVFVLFRAVMRQPVEVSAFGAFAASGFNAVAIGLPVMLGVFGNSGTIPVVVATIIFLVVLVPLTLTLSSMSTGASADSVAVAFGKGLLTTAKNPIVIATAIGLLLGGFDVTLPEVATSSLNTLGAATIVTALVALGMTIELKDVRAGGVEMLWMSAVRCLVAPAAAVGLAFGLGMSDLGSAEFVVMFSLPTAKTVFVLSEQEGAYKKQVAGIVGLTSIAAIVTLPLWITITDHLWTGAF